MQERATRAARQIASKEARWCARFTRSACGFCGGNRRARLSAPISRSTTAAIRKPWPARRCATFASARKTLSRGPAGHHQPLEDGGNSSRDAREAAENDNEFLAAAAYRRYQAASRRPPRSISTTCCF